MKLTYSLAILAALLLVPAGVNLGRAAEPREWAATDGLLQSPDLNFDQARQVLARYQEMLAAAKSPRAPLLRRLAQVCFLLGELAPQSQRPGYYEQGRDYAEQLVQEEPAGVAGHYWLALNLCGLADTGGKLTGYRLLPRIMAELQRALSLDEAYDQAGAHRVLGRIYFEAPGRPWSVGDLGKSLDHLAAAVRLAPENSTNHLYLAETLLRRGEKAQARRELELVLTAKRSAIPPNGLEKDRREARRRLEKLAEQ